MATKIWIGVDGNWNSAANWSPSGVPLDGDDVYFEDSSQSVTAGLDQSAVTLTSLNIAQSYTGQIGDANTYLQIGASAVNIGYHFGPGEAAGSSMLKLNLGATAATIIVSDGGISADTTKPAVRLLYNNASTALEVRKGEVGVAYETGETSTGSSIDLGYVENIEADAKVYIGSGLTLTTLTKKGGFCMLRCGAATVNNYEGELRTEGNGDITTLNVYDGNVISNSSGTVTELNISNKGTVDFTKSAQPRTVTTPKIDDDGAVKFDPNVVTFTDKITSNRPVTLTASAA